MGSSLKEEDVPQLMKLRESPLLNKMDDRIDFWTEPRKGRTCDVNVPPKLQGMFQSWLNHYNISSTTMVEDVQQLIKETAPKAHKKAPGARYTMDWNDYYEHEYHNEFIEALAAENDFASIIDIGQSYEGRDMKILAIEKAGPGAPKIFLEAGPNAFSEIEMQNIVAWFEGLDALPVVTNCFHSYSQLWLWPYGYDYGAYPENWQEVRQLAIDASDALYKVHGTVFDPINSADLYPAAGAADDWYKSKGTRFSFTTELRDTGRYGFVLPADQIIPSGEEMWAGFEAVIAKVLEG